MDSGHQARFHTTHWSLIAALPKRADGARTVSEQDTRAREALEHLCGSYWRPLYAFARYSGYSAEDARDLTQGFLARVIETGGLSGADPDRGRFRSYLLGAMKHFMASARERANAKKRGGGRRMVNLDVADLDTAEMESRIAAPRHAATPADADRAFDRAWAQQTTAAALEELKAEWSGRGKAEQFAALRQSLTGELADRSATAERLGMTENALGVAVHRLRQRYAALVREAVARTVADDADVDDELRYMVAVLRADRA